MSNYGSWAVAIEDNDPDTYTGGTNHLSPPVDVDEDGAVLEGVDMNGDPTFEVVDTEISLAKQEVVASEKQYDELNQTKNQLDSVLDVVNQRVEDNEGLSDGELEFMKIGLEGRLKNVNTLFPSIESRSVSNMSAATEAQFTLREGLEYLWEKLVALYENVVAKIAKWLDTVLLGVDKLKKRARAIEERAEAYNDKTPTEPTFTMTLPKYFRYDVKEGAETNTVEDAINCISKLSESTNRLFSEQTTHTWVRYVKDYGSKLEKFIESHDVEMFKNGQAVKTLTSIPNYEYAGYNVGWMSLEATAYPDYNTMSSDIMPGGMKMYVIGTNKKGVVETTADLKRDASFRGIRFEHIENRNGDRTREVKLTTLAAKDIRDLSSSVANMLEKIDKSRADWGRQNKEITTIQKDITRKLKEVKNIDGADNDRTEFLKVAMQGLIDELKQAPKTDVSYIEYAIARSEDILRYCTRSMAMY